MVSFTMGQKSIKVFPSAKPNKPVIYLNTFNHEGDQVLQQVKASVREEFSLVEISNLKWNYDMVPWDVPPVMKNDDPYTGGANNYLQMLLNDILPEAEKAIVGNPSWRGIAGYSLAGLFALYAMYQTTVFSRIASVSGSLWFPGIKNFIFSHELTNKPDRIYFSLGSRERKTRNKNLQRVQENTEEIEVFFRKQGIETVFQLNPGNHFQDGALRCALGIEWMLTGRKKSYNYGSHKKDL